VAYSIAEVPIQGDTIHDRVEKGWEDLDLKIPRGDGEEELQHALHTWIIGTNAT
jgi:hypothetical protein